MASAGWPWHGRGARIRVWLKACARRSSPARARRVARGERQIRSGHINVAAKPKGHRKSSYSSDSREAEIAAYRRAWLCRKWRISGNCASRANNGVYKWLSSLPANDTNLYQLSQIAPHRHQSLPVSSKRPALPSDISTRCSSLCGAK